jgi:hypothetical protein
MEPVPERLAISEQLDFELVEPTTVLLEPPEKRIYVVCNHMPTMEELVQWTTEAKAGPPEDVRGILIGEVGFPEDREKFNAELARGGGTVIVFECKGHVIYPPSLYSYIWYNVTPEVLSATEIRKEAIKLRRRD